MDFVTHLPRTSQRHDAVWGIVDRLIKLAHFLVVRKTFTLENYAECIFVRLSSYMEFKSLFYHTEIPGLRHHFGRVSKRPWGHS